MSDNRKKVYDSCNIQQPPAFLCGVLCGIILTFIGLEAVRRWRSRSTKSSPCIALIKAHEVGDNACNINAGDQILQEAVKLFLMQTRPVKNKSSTKVVEYLSPEEMLEQLFAFDKTISLNLDPNPTRDRKNEVDQNDRYNQQLQKVDQITHCFRLIQKYSVNTNHPYFFNQLFGAVDPVALAGEIIALSVNTSAYTYETAPVFTMIERNVMENLGRLVFGEFDKPIQNDCDDDDNDDDKIDTKRSYERNNHDVYDQDAYDDECQSRYTGCNGLMLPGGSISNLTALHVARHYAKYGIQEKPPQSQIPSNIHDENSFNDDAFNYPNEEKKVDSHPMGNEIASDSILASSSSYSPTNPQQEFVAFVSSEAHYSFSKAIAVTGIGIENLVVVPTLPNGSMDVNQLEILMKTMYHLYGLSRIPFFVGVTSGSTVRGSFDDIEAIVRVCRKHERRLNSRTIKNDINRSNDRDEFDHRSNAKKHRIWIHVDGAWGGSAIFSSRPDIRGLMRGVQRADSFTFNPHKMFGAPQQTTAFVSRHKDILKAANSSGAKYLFDCRKSGAEYDLGDTSFTCGRRTDSIKLWALLKFHGPDGLGKQLEEKVDVLGYLVDKIRENKHFMLACDPWPFNVNFFFVPERIRMAMIKCGVDINSSTPHIPPELSKELGDISVQLKLMLHHSGEMLIPYQPISNQEADCFRIVLAGYKPFSKEDVHRIIDLIEKYGNTL